MTKANDEASDFDKARTNEIGLIPCPFCGGTIVSAEIGTCGSEDWGGVRCWGCGATMRESCDFRNGVMPSDLLQRAVYKWNRRAVL